MEKKHIDRIFYPVATSLVNSALQTPMEIVKGLLNTKLIYTIDLNRAKWWIPGCLFRKYFRNFPETPNPVVIGGLTRRKQEGIYGAYDASGVDIQECLPDSDGTYYDYCMYRNTPIFIKYVLKSVDDGSGNKASNIELMTIRTKKNVQNIQKFFRRLVRESGQRILEISNDMYHVFDPGGLELQKPYRPDRSFDDVFIPKAKQDEITEAILNFVSSKAWYQEHKIPYHFGLLLHGFPGTGKSSVVQAIAKMFPCDLIVCPPGTLKSFPRHAHLLDRKSEDRITIVVIEDVDTNAFVDPRHQEEDVTLSRERHKKGAVMSSSPPSVLNGKETLGMILNMMDGIGAYENVIYIMTTNHIADLDPALIRPGRIDLQVEIGYVVTETLDKFCLRHYGKHIPDTMMVRDGLTFAHLQTCVMSKMPFEDFVKYCEGGE